MAMISASALRGGPSPRCRRRHFAGTRGSGRAPGFSSRQTVPHGVAPERFGQARCVLGHEAGERRGEVVAQGHPRLVVVAQGEHPGVGAVGVGEGTSPSASAYSKAAPVSSACLEARTIHKPARRPPGSCARRGSGPPGDPENREARGRAGEGGRRWSWAALNRWRGSGQGGGRARRRPHAAAGFAAVSSACATMAGVSSCGRTTGARRRPLRRPGRGERQCGPGRRGPWR